MGCPAGLYRSLGDAETEFVAFFSVIIWFHGSKTSTEKYPWGHIQNIRNVVQNRIAPYFEERRIELAKLKSSDILDYYHFYMERD